MSVNNKVIISCAVTGAIHTPSMSPHLPITPEEIITDSLAAAEAGAAIPQLFCVVVPIGLLVLAKKITQAQNYSAFRVM